MEGQGDEWDWGACCETREDQLKVFKNEMTQRDIIKTKGKYTDFQITHNMPIHILQTYFGNKILYSPEQH